jgi:hypothetical protein
MQSEINIGIGNKAPNIYFSELNEQCNGGKIKYGGIEDPNLLKKNLRMNCIPPEIFNMNIDSYDDFLVERRILISKKIRRYYFSL